MSIIYSRLFSLAVGAVLFLFPLLILTIKGSYNFLAAALLMLGLIFCWGSKNLIEISREDFVFFGSLLIYPFVLLIAMVLQGGKWTALDYPWRALAILPIALMLKTPSVQITCTMRWIQGWLMGALLSGVVALFLVYWRGWLRVGSHITNEIPYGQIAAILALGAFLFIGLYRHCIWRLVCCFAGCGGLYALISSGTRGAWVAFILALFSCGLAIFKWKFPRVAVAMVLFALGILALQHSSLVQSRLDAVRADMLSYQNGDAYTSTGVRLELWRLSAEIAKESPLFGAGPGHFKEALAPKIGEKPFLANYAHAHSQYFDTLANAGFIGLAGLLVSFLAPLVLFWGRLRSSQRLERVFALQGCGLIIVSMVAGLTQPLYAHNISVIFYFICLSVCWGFSSANAVPSPRLEDGME
ncbi:O-antigen ligase family protein [Chitinibacter tainanensis]|uniref:O-antigen ligase family protein n=1 Tax=Chitinibacter tainanensis TaxID=230667 RepID=UPI000420A5DE|nr:O-antigen ligase family protein [Chitinibacter tainanensis]